MSHGVLMSDALAAFGVFARHQNFTRAAEELHIAQPSLHAKINKLGRSLGLILYERVGREVRLSPDGERLAAFALDQARLADDFTASLDRGARRLTIASGRAALQYVISDAIRSVVRSGVEVTVEQLDRTAALDAVANGNADAATIAFDPPPPELSSHHLLDVDQVLAVPRRHPLASQDTVTTADLVDTPLVLPPPERPHRQTLERALRGRCNVAADVDGWDMILHLASLGLGAAVVNGCVKVPRGMVAIPIDDLPRVGYWMVWRSPREPRVIPLLNALTADRVEETAR